MARIPYPDLSQASEAVRAQLGDRPANVSLMLAGASEPVFKGYAAFGSALLNESPLPARLREIAILRAGYLAKADYEVFQHEALARHVGLSDEQLAAIRAGDSSSPALDEAEAAVMAFADDLVLNVRASDATLEAVRYHLDDTQVIDLILVTGTYMMVSRFLETTGVELDSEPIDWNALSDSQ